MSQPSSRRSFMKAAAASGLVVPAVWSSSALAQNSDKEQKLRVAFIGTLGIGAHHLDEFSGLNTKIKEEGLEGKLGITCPCFVDVDKSRWGKAKEMYPEARGYQDYREMIDKESKNFDAAVVGTPDHHHYPATILCMKQGKHVYTQKPLSHTVWEARQLGLAHKKYDKVVTQMGNQGHGQEGWRILVEWVKSGAIGRVKEVHSWTNRPIWPQGIARPEGEDPVPEGLNWDLWVGPAPMRPFKKDVYHPFKWRGWWDFGAGALGDMAAHTMDGVFWALDAFDPIWVEPLAMTPMGGNNETFPKSAVMKWRFPDKEGRPGFDAYWYEGALRPPRPPELEAGRNMPETGNLFVGEKASILIQGDYGNSPRIIPEAKMKEIGRPEKTIPRSPGNYAEWVAASKGLKPREYCGSNFTYSGPMCEVMTLGNVAVRMGQRLEWDHKALKVTNVEAANKLINKEYRDGWKYEI